MELTLGSNELSDIQTKPVKLRVVAAVMMIAALTKISWVAVATEQTDFASRAFRPLLKGPREATAQTEKSGEGTVAPATSATDEPTKALDRLRDAFHSFPGTDQMDLVREINAKSAAGSMACPLAWNDGRPSLYVGGGDAPPSMTAALNQCASEVEKLRVEKSRDLVQ